MRPLVVVSILVCIVLGACTPSPTPTPAPTLTSIPTYTPAPPLPTYTVYPTYTPYPTATPLPATPTLIPTNTPLPLPTATPKPQVGTRSNPVPLGKEATLIQGDQVFVGHVKQVVTGQQAVDMITKGNMFNNVPAEGGKATLIYFVAKYVKGPEDTAGGMSDWYFDFLCGDNQFYANPAVVEPSPSFGGSGFPGATFEGWLCWYSAVTDKPDLLLWKESMLEKQGIYFALK